LFPLAGGAEEETVNFHSVESGLGVESSD
jgi:hypothetical protein